MIYKAKSEGVKLVDAAKMLSVPRTRLFSWYRHGVIKATLVRDGCHKCLVMPRDEVERLKKRMETDE